MSATLTVEERLEIAIAIANDRDKVIADLKRQLAELREREKAQIAAALRQACIVAASVATGVEASNRIREITLADAQAALAAQIASALNEKRLWLCKELGIELSHSWQDIVEYHDTMAHFVEGIKQEIASAEAKLCDKIAKL